VVNLYGEFRTANQNAALFVRADNLLDRRYYNASYGNFPGSPGFFYATPQDSRSVSVGLRLSY
jgi:outer membrane receptor protein involved in Fe transport